MPLAGVIQMTSEPEVQANLAVARAQLERARAHGAVLAALPENFAILGRREGDKVAVAEIPGQGPIQDFLASCARELGLWILAGTVPLRLCESASKRIAAASLLFDAHGNCVTRYDKIHLFDVEIPERAERYQESATVAAGSQLVVVPTPIGNLGLAVCYDVRFPELFRALQARGAEVFSLPSAFTTTTGRAHWNVLVRARAVENLCYVLAPAQGGRHPNGRETWGESMIVDPWGRILAQVAKVGPGLAVAEIDRTVQADLRRAFPALTHRQLA